ncbi:MAG: hypothetical protein A2Z16_05905 [Chloroflexi bacterium RBG_16_54_18]|nr:MAG: hypothetical protein A2Z16_05905 [Chloroflexi bacterium RBG_16_54_18]
MQISHLPLSLDSPPAGQYAYPLDRGYILVLFHQIKQRGTDGMTAAHPNIHPGILALLKVSAKD